MELTDKDKYLLAKSFTELAIQHGFINKCSNPSDSAKEASDFFNTVIAEIGKTKSAS